MSKHDETMTTDTPRVLLDGFAMVESPRWHDGRFWFAHWKVGEVIAVDLDGNHEVMAQGPQQLGWSIDWLPQPDGRLLITGPELLRQEADGSLVQHADLSHIANHGWNEIVVDGRGNIYLNGMGFNFMGGGKPEPGIIALVTPDGEARQVADGIDFPNGMAVTPDNKTLLIAESFAGQLTAFDIADDGSLDNRRVWAGGIGPDSICLDAEGCVWTHSADTQLHTGRADRPAGEAIRVREGGEILQRIPFDRPSFGCTLGGPDRRTLFLTNTVWRGVEQAEAVLAERTGQVLVTRAPAPGAGYP
jgi:sugar lactone lactonase YvrE